MQPCYPQVKQFFLTHGVGEHPFNMAIHNPEEGWLGNQRGGSSSQNLDWHMATCDGRRFALAELEGVYFRDNKPTPAGLQQVYRTLEERVRKHNPFPRKWESDAFMQAAKGEIDQWMDLMLAQIGFLRR